MDEGHKPVKGALVRIQNTWNGVWNSFNSLGVTRTDRDGHFRLWCSTDVREVISRDPWLRIEKEGYGVGFYWDFLKKDLLGTLVLPRGGTIAGRVVDGDGKPLANCQVWVYALAQPTRQRRGPIMTESTISRACRGSACSRLSISARTPTSTVRC